MTYTVDDAQAELLLRSVEEHVLPAARQTQGYLGMALFDLGDGQRMAELIFESLEDVRPAQEALTPVGREHTYALMSGPAIGSAGTVLLADDVLSGSSSE